MFSIETITSHEVVRRNVNLPFKCTLFHTEEMGRTTRNVPGQFEGMDGGEDLEEMAKSKKKIKRCKVQKVLVSFHVHQLPEMTWQLVSLI